MRRVFALVWVTALLAVTGCTGSDDGAAQQAAADTKAEVVVTVDIDPQICLPKGALGNCWLPLFRAPVLGGGAVNASAACSNTSSDQRSCWPQNGATLKADCLSEGADKRPWYGFIVPRERVFDKSEIAELPADEPVRAFASVEHVAVTSGRVGDLDPC